MKKFTSYYRSPIGILEISSSEQAITGVHFVQKNVQESSTFPDVLRQCVKELEKYFAGELREFTVPVNQEGTVFQKSVWNALLTIPFGTTVSYSYIAEQIGNLKSVRAVGTTNGKNNIAIIVPCHRVIGANGKMLGYAGEIWRKLWLLEHEKNTLLGIQKLF